MTVELRKDSSKSVDFRGFKNSFSSFSLISNKERRLVSLSYLREKKNTTTPPPPRPPAGGKNFSFHRASCQDACGNY